MGNDGITGQSRIDRFTEFNSVYIDDMVARIENATDIENEVVEERDFALVVEFGEGFRRVFEEDVSAGLIDGEDASYVG